MKLWAKISTVLAALLMAMTLSAHALQRQHQKALGIF